MSTHCQFKIMTSLIFIRPWKRYEIYSSSYTVETKSSSVNLANHKAWTALSLFCQICSTPEGLKYHLNSSRKNTNLFWKESQMLSIGLNIDSTLARDILHLNRMYTTIQTTLQMSITTNLDKPKRKQARGK